MLSYSELWNKYDPLYNNPEYAAKTRWGQLPAMPCYIFKENITGFPMMDDVGNELGNVFYYAKYEKDGKKLADLTCWAETLDGDIIQVVEAAVELLSRVYPVIEKCTKRK